MLRRRIGAVIAGLAVASVFLFEAYEYAESPASQLFGPTVVSGPATRHEVALTFDDGPNPPYTNEILRVLEREGVHATFFVVGRAVQAYPEIVRREVRDGDALGNHTWDHAHLIVMSAGQVAHSLQATAAAIARATGTRTTFMRPPYGKRDWLVLGEARRLGYTPVMWSVPLTADWENPPPQAIAQRALRAVRNGSIIVLHDGNEGLPGDRHSTVQATRLIVDALKRRGYRLVTIPQLLATPAP
jgi:peptidoglycan-N-acetylglucosamine deacetylase